MTAKLLRELAIVPRKLRRNKAYGSAEHPRTIGGLKIVAIDGTEHFRLLLTKASYCGIILYVRIHDCRSPFMLNFNVLVLNASYEAINICNLKRAITLIFKGVACAEEQTDHEIRSASMVIKAPTVIRLLKYIRIPYRTARFSRKNVLLRDNYRCQYCGERFTPNLLTLDHVKPLSQGGKTQWDNVVTACKTCNIKKGNRNPPEAGMNLLQKPKAPPVVYYLHLVRNAQGHHHTWQKYLFLDYQS